MKTFLHALSVVSNPAKLFGPAGTVSVATGLGWYFHPAWGLIFFGAILLLLAAKKR